MGTDIDHFRPKGIFPERTFDWANHYLACSYCNSNQKRDRFPVDADGLPLLIDVAAEDPLDHLVFDPVTGDVAPRNGSEKGRATIEVFGLNRQVAREGRQDAWVNLNVIAAVYPTSGPVRRAEILRSIRRSPFQAVRAHLIRRLDEGRLAGIDSTALQAISDFPELIE